MEQVSGLALLGKFHLLLLLLQVMRWKSRAGPSSLGFISVQFSPKFIIPGFVLKSAHIPSKSFFLEGGKLFLSVRKLKL